MNLLSDKKYASRIVAVHVSVCWMVLFYFKIANVIRLALAKLFQAVSRLLSSFMSICGNHLAIKRVHTAHVFVI